MKNIEDKMEKTKFVSRIAQLFMGSEDEKLVSYLAGGLSEPVDVVVFIANDKVIVSAEMKESSTLYVDRSFIKVKALMKNGAMISALTNSRDTATKCAEILVRINTPVTVNVMNDISTYSVDKPRYSVGDVLCMVGNRKNSFTVERIHLDPHNFWWMYHDKFGYAAEHNVRKLEKIDFAKDFDGHLVWIEAKRETKETILVDSFEDRETRRKIEDWELRLLVDAGVSIM